MSQAPSLLKQLTLEEKAALCVGATPWTTTGLPARGVDVVRMSDGPHGVRLVPDPAAGSHDSVPATCFPTAVALASTWDVDLLSEVGRALGREARALGVDLLLGPGVNIKRVPLCGRNFEYFSEDPYLAGELAVAYIEGLQSEGVGASLKHFALNNQEFERNAIDVEVDERALFEIYLPAFEAAVTRARPWTVMAAYNRVGGDLCVENARLLREILVEAWGFEGAIVSDWGAVRDPAASLNAGLHLEMPGPKASHVRSLVEAVEQGRLDAARLDEAALRVLRLAERAVAARRPAAVDADAHHALARRAAAEGMVLLANGGALPLAPGQRVAAIGSSAKTPKIQGGGSAKVRPNRLDTPFEALRALLGDALRYAEGWGEGGEDAGRVAEAVALARDADVALVFAAMPGSLESEGYDRERLELPDAQVDLIRAVAATGRPTVVVLNTGGAVDTHAWIGEVDAVVQAWTMGQAGGAAIADVLTGRVNPSGKLAETYPRALADTPAYLSYPGENGVAPYRESIFVGYRYYEARGAEVAFPFGHGLSYTRFAYDDLRLSSERVDEGESLTVSFGVTNVGERAGKEIAQVYVRDPVSRLRRPPKELKAFAKIALEPGERRTVTLTLGPRAFAYYDPAHHAWVAEPGAFEVQVGASSADIRLRASLTLRPGRELPCILDRDSTLREWLDDRRGRDVLAPLVEQIRARVSQSMGGEHGEVIGMDLDGFLMNMPLINVLAFHEEEAGVSATDQVDALLARARGAEAPRETAA